MCDVTRVYACVSICVCVLSVALWLACLMRLCAHCIAKASAGADPGVLLVNKGGFRSIGVAPELSS